MNKTVYLKQKEDSEVWVKASRLLRFHYDISLGEWITSKLKVFVEVCESEHQDTTSKGENS